jgi:peptidoglycan hydrolase-like protein with peptidoglycan-binding domain
MTLFGLTASTLYHFFITSQDASSNVSTTTDMYVVTASTPVIPPVVSGGGGGGGGGGGTYYPIIPYTGTSTATTSLGFSVPSPTVFTPQAVAAFIAESTSGRLSSAVVVSGVRLGSKGSNVSRVQEFLVNKGLLRIPPGVTKGSFGQATKKAVISYQRSVGIRQTGEVGPLTAAAINKEIQVSSGVEIVDVTQNIQAVPKVVVTGTWNPGQTGQEVRDIQTLLAFYTSFFPAESINGKFGPRTVQAVKDFQCLYKIACNTGDVAKVGWGRVGVSTRAALNALAK